jgi:hypothetical protein
MVIGKEGPKGKIQLLTDEDKQVCSKFRFKLHLESIKLREEEEEEINRKLAEAEQKENSGDED